MPEISQSVEGITILKVKTEITVQLQVRHGHLIKGKFRSFQPQKLIVEAWRGKDGLPEKAYVVALDISLVQPGGKRFPDSVKYNLIGTPYPAVPKWIAKVIREYGYQDPIERMV